MQTNKSSTIILVDKISFKVVKIVGSKYTHMGRLISIPEPPPEANYQSLNINDILTDSLLFEILQRLPWHSTLGAKSVCKRWFSIVSDPYFYQSFTRHHDQHCRTTHYTLVYEFSYWHRHLTETLHFKLHPVSQHPVFNSRGGFHLDFLPRKSQPVCVVASHKDLLVYCDPKLSSQRAVYIICNPLTKQWVTLPPSPGWHRVADTAIGFISSKKTIASQSNFKLVRVPELGFSSTRVDVEVFCSEIGEWRNYATVCSTRVKRTWQFKPNAITFKDKLHWLVNGENVVVFDPFEGIRGASFRVIDLPLQLNSVMGTCLGLCGEHLKVTQVTGGTQDRVMVVWKLEDYDNGKWELEYKVSLKETVLVDDRFLHNFKYLTAEVLAFHPNDAGILYLRLDNYIVKYDVRRKTVKMVSECFRDSSFSIGTCGVFLLLHPCWPSSIPPVRSTYKNTIRAMS